MNHPNYLLVRIHSGRELLLGSWKPSHLPAEAIGAVLAASVKALFLTLEQLSIWAARKQRALPSRAVRPRILRVPSGGLFTFGVEVSGQLL